MGKIKTKNKSFSALTSKGLKLVKKRLIEREIKNDGYLIVADKNGKVKKIAASKL